MARSTRVLSAGALAVVLLVASFSALAGADKAQNEEEQALIDATLEARADEMAHDDAFDETHNTGCLVLDHMDDFKKLVGEESRGWTMSCKEKQFDTLIAQATAGNGLAVPGDSIYRQAIQAALKNPTPKLMGGVGTDAARANFVFDYSPVPSRAEVKLSHPNDGPYNTADGWSGMDESENHMCANLIIRTLFEIDTGAIPSFKGCAGRDMVDHKSSKWTPECTKLDDPEFDCMRTVLFCEDQACWDEAFGWREVAYERNGPKGIGNFGALAHLEDGEQMTRKYPILDCQCTAMNINNYGPPLPVQATCDTFTPLPGWNRNDNAEELSCLDTACVARECNGCALSGIIHQGQDANLHGIQTGLESTGRFGLGPGRHVTLDDTYKCAYLNPIYCDMAECPEGWQAKPDGGDIVCAGVAVPDGGKDDLACLTDYLEIEIDSDLDGKVDTWKLPIARESEDTPICCDAIPLCEWVTCSSWNYNGLIYEPDPEKKFCPSIDPDSCDQFSCCIETRCKPVEHCVGLLGCMAPEQESSCSACAEGYFGGNCIACPGVEHTTPGTTYACTSTKDVTIVKGGCIEGYYHKSGGAGAKDSCVECPLMDRCMTGFVTCSDEHNAVCSKCAGGWTGDHCQHEPVIPGIDYNLCSGHGYVEGPDCVGGGCMGEKWMIGGVEVGPQYRWVTGSCIYYPAGKMRGLEALSMDLRRKNSGALGEYGSSSI
jgi:hypothetical protein